MAKRFGSGDLTRTAKKQYLNVPIETSSESFLIRCSNLTNKEKYPDNTPWHFSCDIFDGQELTYPPDTQLCMLSWHNDRPYRPANTRYLNDRFKLAEVRKRWLWSNREEHYVHSNEDPLISTPAMTNDYWENCMAHAGILGVYGNARTGDIQLFNTWNGRSAANRVRGYLSCTYTGSELNPTEDFEAIELNSRYCSRAFINLSFPFADVDETYVENRSGMARILSSIVDDNSTVFMNHRGMDTGTHFESQRDKTGFENDGILESMGFRSFPTRESVPLVNDDWIDKSNRLGKPIHNNPVMHSVYYPPGPNNLLPETFAMAVPILMTRWHLPTQNYAIGDVGSYDPEDFSMHPLPLNSSVLFRHEKRYFKHLCQTSGLRFGFYSGHRAAMYAMEEDDVWLEQKIALVDQWFIDQWNFEYPNQPVTKWTDFRTQGYGGWDLPIDYAYVQKDFLPTLPDIESIGCGLHTIPLDGPDFFLDEREILVRCPQVLPKLWNGGKWDTVIASHIVENVANFRDEVDGIGDQRDLKQHVFKESGGQNLLYRNPYAGDRFGRFKLISNKLQTLTFDFTSARHNTPALFDPTSETTVELALYSSW